MERSLLPLAGLFTGVLLQTDDEELPPLPGDDSEAPLPPADADEPLLPPGADSGPPPPPGADSGPPLPQGESGPPLPPVGDGPPSPSGSGDGSDAAFPIDITEEEAAELMDPQTVPLPLIGNVNAEEMGIFAFTVVIGLVDGFNPCAMWVLLFLLSLLVNLKDRKRMFAIAGVFVLISGIAYFIFMIIWLEFMLLVGLVRWIQYSLGILAILIGGIHMKDFFAFKKGISLSISDSAKSGINLRMRKILSAETLWAALLGASVLAVMVNILEMLCTAGLPALYTNILAMRDYPAWKYYAYIGLYNVAYMFDDSIMVIIAVVTLGKRRLEETGGRWLKLVSGALIFGIGVLMIFKPEWLGQSPPNEIKDSRATEVVAEVESVSDVE